MTNITKTGIYPGFPIASYFADPCPRPSLTQSIAKILINQSPAHARWAHPRLRPQEAIEEEEEHKKAKTIGDVAHKMILGRGKEVMVVDFPDWRTKAAKEMRDHAIENGQVPILTAHATQSMRIKAAFDEFMLEHPAGPELTGTPELVIAWEENGFWFRSMIDMLSESMCIVTDLKTTDKDMPPDKVPANMAESGWDIQCAMHERGLNKLDPDNAGRRIFRFITIEQNPPFGIVVNELPESVLTIGRRKLSYAIRIWQECLEADKWPNYASVVHRPEYPSWAESRWLDREQALFAEGT